MFEGGKLPNPFLRRISASGATPDHHQKTCECHACGFGTDLTTKTAKSVPAPLWRMRGHACQPENVQMPRRFIRNGFGGKLPTPLLRRICASGTMPDNHQKTSKRNASWLVQPNKALSHHIMCGTICIFAPVSIYLRVCVHICVYA